MTAPPRSPVLRFLAYTLSGVFLAAGAALAWYQVDRFLIRDPRFALATEEETEEPAVLITGVKHASRERILEPFQPDKGRSVYLLPLAARREAILAVAWVRDATVTRIWPNHIAVHIAERRPVAFVQSGPTVQLLIDEEGVLLPLGDSGKFRLPVVIGVDSAQPVSDRRLRVRRLLRLQQEIGRQMEKVSEVDLSDLDNVKITYPFKDRAMILFLGHQHYARRLKVFLDNVHEVAARFPGARILDLRLDDRITVVPESAPRRAPEGPRAE